MKRSDVWRSVDQARQALLDGVGAERASSAELRERAVAYGRLTARTGIDAGEALDLLLGAASSEGLTIPGAVLAAIVSGHASVPAGGGEGVGGSVVGSREAKLSALYRINQAATASLALDQMLQTVVRVVRETMAGESCSIFLYDDASNTLRLRASVGLNPEADGQVTLPMGAGITGQAAVRREVLAVPDAQSHPAYLDYPKIQDRPYSSQVSVPLALRSPDRLVGVLNILSLRRREFDPDELAFLEAAAGELAIAIENARLYSETDAKLQRRIAQLATLQSVSRMVASTLDLSELLGLISRQTTQLAGAAAAEIYRLQGGENGQLELLARWPPEPIEGLEAINEGVRSLVGDVMQSGAAIWRRFRAQSSLYVCAVPMLTGRRAVGAICVFHRQRPVGQDDTEGLLGAFSDSAAVAIENAELYEEARRGYTRASTLLLEMHHRVRNNLQTVAALLSMQARHAGDAAWREPLAVAVSRIQSIAAVHDLLSAGNLRETTIDTIARHVAEEASINVIPPDLEVAFVIPPSDVRLSSRQATVLALLINEFIANAVQHGFAGRRHGRVEITTDCRDGAVTLTVRDDGLGLPAGFLLDRDSGLGLQIAATLARVDLRGSLDVRPHPEGGTLVCLRFTPAGADKER